MKKKYSIIIIGLLAIAPTLMSNWGGSPGGRTGSPGDNGNTCATNGGCHGPKTPISQEMISTDAGVNGYVPGDSITVTISAARNGIIKYGFEIMAEDSSDNPKGAFSGNSRVTSTNPIRATHKAQSAIGTNNSNSWEMRWKAPDSGTGTVKFYVAVLATNNNGGTGGDNVLIDTLELQEDRTASVNTPSHISFNVYPNPTTDFIHIDGVNDTDKLTITSVLGKEMYVGTTTSTLDVRFLPNGVYFLNLQKGNSRGSQKFTISR